MNIRAWRWPVLLLMPALIVGGAVVGNSRQSSNSDPARVAVPAVSADDSFGSTWYCAAGSATGTNQGFAEQTILISNPNDDARNGLLTVVTSTDNTKSKRIEIPAKSVAQFLISDVVTAPWAAALVEVEGGGVSVTHEVLGTAGYDAGPCASAPSSQWYFPSGTTLAGTRNLLALFNPFPSEAAVDISFDTDDGLRAPQAFQGLVLPGGTLTVVDIGEVVTLRKYVSTTVIARTGRVIAEQLQSGDGRENIPSGLSLTLGASGGTSQWVFPVSVPVQAAVSETIEIINTEDRDITVEIQVIPDKPEENGYIEPFEIAVPRLRTVSVNVGGDGRIPRAIGHSFIVSASDNANIVVQRMSGGRGESAGLSLLMGTPIAATEWTVPALRSGTPGASSLHVLNPLRDTTATVEVVAYSNGRLTTIGRPIELSSGERVRIDTQAIATATTASFFIVRSSSPVAVTALVRMTTPTEVALMNAIAYLRTISLLSPVAKLEAPGIEIDATDVVPEEAPEESSTSSSSSSSSSSTVAADPNATTTTVAGATTTLAPNQLPPTLN